MNQNFKTYHLKITTLSPVHIGSSDEYEPTNYVICSNMEKQKNVCPLCGKELTDRDLRFRHCPHCDEDIPVVKPNTQQNGFLYTFTPNELSLSGVNMSEMLQVSKTGSLQQVQSFFYKNCSKIAKTGKKRATVAPDVLKEYNEKAGKENDRSNNFNSLRIEKVICNELTGVPYIPGSSLKGAIRTAWLNSIERERKYQPSAFGEDSKTQQKNYEKVMLDFKKIDEDPFKEIKISDATPVQSFMTSIEKAANKKRKLNKASSNMIKTFIEVIPEGVTFEAKVNLLNHCDKDSNFYNSQYEMGEIAKACNKFSQSLIDIDSEDQICHHNIQDAFFKKMELLMKQSNKFVMRVGKHTGAEGVTIEGLRSIPIKGKGGEKQYKPNATTFWFANNGKQLRPFGWVVVEFTEVK